MGDEDPCPARHDLTDEELEAAMTRDCQELVKAVLMLAVSPRKAPAASPRSVTKKWI